MTKALNRRNASGTNNTFNLSSRAITTEYQCQGDLDHDQQVTISWDVNHYNLSSGVPQGVHFCVTGAG